MSQLPFDQALFRFTENEERYDLFLNEDVWVQTNKGTQYPSAPMASRLLVENGLVGATPFATKADMQASALVDGDFAVVTQEESPEDNGVYEKLSGVWTYSKYNILPQAKTYTDTKTEKLDDWFNTENYAFSLSDGLMNVAFAVTNEGVTQATEIETPSIVMGDSTQNNDGHGIAWAVTDKDENAAAYITNEGQMHTASLDTEELLVRGRPFETRTYKTGGNYPANLNHLEIFGQSLSQGALSLPLQTTVQRYDSLMFVGGLRPVHPAYEVPDFFADFIPLVEATAADGYAGHETPCGGATDAVKQFIEDENGVHHTEQAYMLLGSACGQGGRSIQQLIDTYLQTELKPAMTAAYNLAQEKGWTYDMPLIGWCQGENDNRPSDPTTIQSYQDSMQTLIAELDTHLKTLDPSLSMGGLVTTQLCSFVTSGRTAPHIEIAIYEAAMAPNSNVYLACPLYIFDYADQYHVDGVSSKWMGAYIGLAYKRVVVDGEDWKPIHPLSHKKQGSILEVKFHVPAAPLRWDTEHIAAVNNYGFTLADGAGADIPILSITLSQPDTLKIITAAPLPAGSQLRYGWAPLGRPNRRTGVRGNLRDSQGDRLIFDPEGINKPMHNWSPIFQYEVA